MPFGSFKRTFVPNINPDSYSTNTIWIDADSGITGVDNSNVTGITNQTGGTSVQYRGCNLVGGGAQGSWEGWQSAIVANRDPGLGPRTPNNYTFVTTADIDYCISKGMNIFRLLFIHEAIQPEANATIPYAGGLPNPTRYSNYYTTFKARVDYITITKGKICLIDIHNAEGSFPTGWVSYYLRQFSMTPSASQEDGNTLANLWSQLATIFLNNSNVWFGIHNEPTVSSAQWYPVAQAVIDAIRATGNTNRICMPGINTDGARDWLSGSNHTNWAALTDSANNMIAQIHNYYDPDNSGTRDIIPNTTYEPDMVNGSPATPTNIGEARFTGVTNWARTNGKKLFIGELAMDVTATDLSDQTAQMTATWANTIDFIKANADVIIGYCWWEYGNSGWAGNIFDLRQATGPIDNARMNVIRADFVNSINSTATAINVNNGTQPTWSTAQFRSGTKHGINFNNVWCWTNPITLSTGASFWMVVRYTSTDTTVTTTGNCPLTLYSDDTVNNIISVGFSAGTPSYTYKVSGSYTINNSSKTNLNDDLPHSVCWTHDTSGNLNCYVDGVLTNSFAGVTYDTANTNINVIGTGKSDTDSYIGKLAEGMIYSGVLTGQQIRNLHTRAALKWY